MAMRHNRTLTVIAYQHDMYGKDVVVNFCDIFSPPPGLYCLSVGVFFVSCSVHYYNLS